MLREEQTFRIDHFLGKETVQNIMALRFANGMFEPLWNRDRIDHVQITVAETVGVEGRGKFYEHAGALRDMVPNHVFQLLSMVAMEPPAGFDARSIRSRKEDVYSALQSVQPDCAVRGQYGAGTVLGKPVRAYREEPDVAPDSNVETYVAMRLSIDNWRWAGVPFYLRTGKHMSARYAEIAIRFKPPPMRRSRTPRSTICRPTGWSSTSSRRRRSTCNSKSSAPARWSISPRCRCASATTTGSSRNRMSATRPCSTTA